MQCPGKEKINKCIKCWKRKKKKQRKSGIPNNCKSTPIGNFKLSILRDLKQPIFRSRQLTQDL